MKLWYKQPAKQWTEALPLGNGNLGAMVYGDPDSECISMNDDTLWSGYPKETGVDNPEPVLEKVRQLIAEGHLSEADRLIETGLLGSYSQSYLPLCNIAIENKRSENAPFECYHRQLELDDAIMNIDYCRNNTAFHRELFISKPDELMIMRMSADKEAVMSFDIGMNSQLHSSCLAYYDRNHNMNISEKKKAHKTQESSELDHRAFILMHGLAPSEDYPDYTGKRNPVVYEQAAARRGMRFAALIEIRTSGGTIRAGEYEDDEKSGAGRTIRAGETEDDGKSCAGGTVRAGEYEDDEKSGAIWTYGEKRRQCVQVRDCDECEIRFFSATSYNGSDRLPFTDGRNETVRISELQKKAEKKSFEEIKSAHIKDYSSLYSSVSIYFGKEDRAGKGKSAGADIAASKNDEKPSGKTASADIAATRNENIHTDKTACTDIAASRNEDIPTDERLNRFAKTGHDPYLYALIYQYGRYLAIAASRPGTQPMNLQGIWNDKLCPPFSCNYTTNINLEMNYWGIEEENLSELGEPLFKFIGRLTKSGKRTAGKYYGAKGAVVHHNTDIWAMTTPVGKGLPGMSTCAFWNTAYGWLTRHLFEHYEYTLDTAFLRASCLPALYEAAHFFVSIMIQTPEGVLIMPPSSSPENTFICKGEKAHNTIYTAMSVAIVKETFKNFIKTCDILAEAEKKPYKKLYDTVKKSIGKLPPYRIGSRGQLLEWDREYEEIEPHHRHISQLYPLFPGNELHMADNSANPEQEQLINACRRSLIERTDVGTGWSLGWKINAWARLQDGNHALQLLKRQLQPTTEQRTLALFSEGKGSGTYPNLFDAHPPFQIDGNFAAASGISEMLLQSYDNKVLILPALPEELPDGRITGFRTKNALRIDVSFAAGRLEKAIVHSLSDKMREIIFVYFGKSCRRVIGDRAENPSDEVGNPDFGVANLPDEAEKPVGEVGIPVVAAVKSSDEAGNCASKQALVLTPECFV